MNRVWLRQVAAVLRIELGKSLFTVRAMPIYLLALLPIGAVSMVVLVSLMYDPPSELEVISGAAMFYAVLYQFILRLFVYAGCVWIFMNLFRGEVLDRSLHYYFLAPIRREVLVVGKFVSGWVSAALVFGGSALASMVILYGYFGISTAARYLLIGPGLGQMTGYLGVTLLACLGYGAVFLVVGLFFRNPIVPALLIWIWEGINPFLPPLLKKISVIFYLESLLPVRVSDGPFALIAEPTPAWLAVPGLLVFAAVTLVAAGLRIRGMEIAYGAD